MLHTPSPLRPREWFEENLAWVTSDEDLDDLLHMGNHITNTKKLESYKDRLTDLEENKKAFEFYGWDSNRTR